MAYGLSTLSSGNWDPTLAANYISLSWNRDGYRIAPDAVVPAVLTLQVSSSIQDVSNFICRHQKNSCGFP
jgi:hypothetical protein